MTFAHAYMYEQIAINKYYVIKLYQVRETEKERDLKPNGLARKTFLRIDKRLKNE